MKVYYGTNKKGVWKASLDHEKVSHFDNLREVELPVVHGRIYMVKTYYGYDYDAYSLDDDFVYSAAYYSVSSLKKNCWDWKNKEQEAKENPDKFHVTPFSIASDDLGEPFTYGDVMDGKFNMTIIPIRVI